MTTRYLSIVATFSFCTSLSLLSVSRRSLLVLVLVSFDTSIDRNHPSKSESISRIIVIWERSVFPLFLSLSYSLSLSYRSFSLVHTHTTNNCKKWLELNALRVKKMAIVAIWFKLITFCLVDWEEDCCFVFTSSLTDLLCRKDIISSSECPMCMCVWKEIAKVASSVSFVSPEPFWDQHHRKKIAC